MSENLNIDVEAMLNQLPPEMQKQMQAQMQTFINIMKGGQNAVVPQAGPSAINKKEIPENPGLQDYTELYCDCFKKGEIGCVTRAEQFSDSDMYRILFSVNCGEIRRNEVQYRLEMLAKELGGMALVRYFKKNCMAAKREIKERQKHDDEMAEQERKKLAQKEREKILETGNMTKFTELPEGCKNIYIGPGWVANDDGIYMLEESGKTVRRVEAGRFPFLIDCLYEPYDAGAIGAEKCGIRFKSVQGDWRHKIVEQSTLMDSREAMTLAKKGYSINSRRAMAFTDYATAMLEESAMRGALPIHKMASSFGWTSDKKEFLPYTNNEFVFEKEDEFPGLTQAISQSQGDRETWYREFKEMRQTRVKMFNFATIVLLASPILGMLPDVVNGFIGNIYGDTHTGKTICDSINATIFGDFREGYVIALTPQSTPTGMEIRMNAHKNIPLVVEDANNADPNMIPKFIMQASNGAGALRGTKNMGNRAQMSWCLSSLVNSEAILTSYGNRGGVNGGSYTRVYAVKSGSQFPKVWEEKIGYWKEFFATNYGFAGRDFVEILQGMELDELQAMKKKFFSQIVARMREIGHSETQAEGLAILILADYLAATRLFKDDIMFTIDELISFTEDEETIKPAKRFYNKLEDLMIGNPDRFEGLDENLTERIADPLDPAKWVGEYWGLYRMENQQRWLCVRPEVLDRWLADRGVDRRLFFDFLRENDLIRADKGANTRKTPSKIYSTRPRLVNIRLIDSDCADEDDLSQPGVEENAPQNPFLKVADEINTQRQLQIEEIEFK